jgi:hypothetical protein
VTQLERNVQPWRLRPIVKWCLAIAICGIGWSAARHQRAIALSPPPTTESTDWIAEPDLSTNLLWLTFPAETTVARIHPTVGPCTDGRLLMLLNDGTATIILRAHASGDGSFDFKDDMRMLQSTAITITCHDHAWHLVERSRQEETP